MRVWVVGEQQAADPASLENVVRQLAARLPGELVLLGGEPLTPECATGMRGSGADVIVASEPSWPEVPWTEEILGVGAALVVAACPERLVRFRALATIYPLVFVPQRPAADVLWLALLGAYAAHLRQLHSKDKVDGLEHRLADRIIIERAKGILVNRLRITEEEAYNRLRVLSRRQRRQMRDIAQSLLDTQTLLAPGGNAKGNGNGEAGHRNGDPSNGAAAPTPSL